MKTICFLNFLNTRSLTVSVTLPVVYFKHLEEIEEVDGCFGASLIGFSANTEITFRHWKGVYVAFIFCVLGFGINVYFRFKRKNLNLTPLSEILNDCQKIIK